MFDYFDEPLGGYQLNVEILLAVNYGRLGRHDEALKMLKDALGQIEGNAELIKVKGDIYHHIADIYHQLRRYEKALKNLDTAAKYIDKGSTQILDNLHLRALILLDDNRREEGMSCLNEGLRLCDVIEKKTGVRNSIFYYKLAGLKYSVTLDEPLSLFNLENIVIPGILAMRMDIYATPFYETLSSHFSKAGLYKQAEYYERKVVEMRIRSTSK